MQVAQQVNDPNIQTVISQTQLRQHLMSLIQNWKLSSEQHAETPLEQLLKVLQQLPKQGLLNSSKEKFSDQIKQTLLKSQLSNQILIKKILQKQVLKANLESKNTFIASNIANLELCEKSLTETVSESSTEALSGVKQCVGSSTEAPQKRSLLEQFFAKHTSKCKAILAKTYQKWKGLSTFKKILIGGFTIIVISSLAYYIYRRVKKGGNAVEQRRALVPLNQEQMQQQAPPQNFSNVISFQCKIPFLAPYRAIPQNKGQWCKIQMSQESFNELLSLTQQASLVELVQGNICPFTNQVMKFPSQMKCCKHKKEKQDRWAERAMLEHVINKLKRCILCFQPATLESIIFDQRKYSQIIGIRQRVFKTYTELNVQQKKQWKKLIDGYFGIGYTDRYLGRIVN